MTVPSANVKIEGHILFLSPLELRTQAGNVVPLRAKSLEVLRVLALSADHLVPKLALFKAVWPGTYASEDSLVQCIREIRQALGQAGTRVIQTEYKRGYRLVSNNSSYLSGSSLRGFSQRISQAASRDGSQIGYAVSGRGPVLARAPHWLTHVGLDWRTGILGPTLMRLSESFTLIRIDSRGTGSSDRAVSSGTLSEWIEDVQAVMDAEGIERCSMLGFSAGAFVAIRYAALNPQRVASLVLLGAMVRGDLHRGVSERHIAAIAQLIRDGWSQDNPAFRELITTSLWPEAGAEDRAGFNRLQRDSASASNAASLYEAFARTNVHGDLDKVTAPTLLLHALHEHRIPYSEAELTSKSLSDCRLLGLDSSNHLPVWSEPAFEKSIQEILRFLQINAQSGMENAR